MPSEAAMEAAMEYWEQYDGGDHDNPCVANLAKRIDTFAESFAAQREAAMKERCAKVAIEREARERTLAKQHMDARVADLCLAGAEAAECIAAAISALPIGGGE